jgi:hypothetical protein
MRQIVHFYTPFGNSKHPSIPGFKNKIGRGMGSVLLQTGGPGGASSYPSLQSYVDTTGRNPSHEAPKFSPLPHASGRGVSIGLKSKIKALIPKPTKERKPSNINFSL